MNSLPESLGLVAPYYNLVMVLIVVILFAKLFTIQNKNVFLLPWKLMFLSVVIFIVEEILTIFNSAGILTTPRILNAVFEFIIITIFIYTLLIQKEHLTKKHKNKK